MLALSLSDKFCCFGIFVFVFNFFVFVSNRFLFSRFSFHHFFVLVLVFHNEFVIFSFFIVFILVNENHTDKQISSLQHKYFIMTVWYKSTSNNGIKTLPSEKYTTSPCGLQGCKNTAHSVSWLEVVKGISNYGVLLARAVVLFLFCSV